MPDSTSGTKQFFGVLYCCGYFRARSISVFVPAVDTPFPSCIWGSVPRVLQVPVALFRPLVQSLIVLYQITLIIPRIFIARGCCRPVIAKHLYVVSVPIFRWGGTPFSINSSPSSIRLVKAVIVNVTLSDLIKWLKSVENHYANRS